MANDNDNPNQNIKCSFRDSFSTEFRSTLVHEVNDLLMDTNLNKAHRNTSKDQ